MEGDIVKDIYVNVIEKFRHGGMAIYSPYVLSDINYAAFLSWVESNILNQ